MTREKRKPFQVYIEDFRPLPKASLWQRTIVDRVKSLSVALFAGALFAYPVTLVLVGVIFGGLIFWSTFVGSFIVIGLIIHGLGFSHNFRNWDISMKRMLATVMGGMVALGWYEGILYFKGPLFLLVLGLVGLAGIIVALRR